jgi:hypothetical protein
MFSEVARAWLQQTKWQEDSGQAKVSAIAWNCQSRFQTYVPLYILPAHHSVQTFRYVYYSLPFYLGNFPIEDVQYYYSRQHNLVKKTDLILNGGIFTNILMLQVDNVK